MAVMAAVAASSWQCNRSSDAATATATAAAAAAAVASPVLADVWQDRSGMDVVLRPALL